VLLFKDDSQSTYNLLRSCCCLKMIYCSEYLLFSFVLLFEDGTFTYAPSSCCSKMTYGEHLLILLRTGVSKLFTVNIYLSSFVLLFQDDSQCTFTYPPLCCCFKMIYSKHLLIFLHSAVLKWSTVKIYLSSFVLLFKDDIQ
jgi:hypothetical protein